MSAADHREDAWDGTMPPADDPWPIPMITQEPNPQHDRERRARWIEAFNKGVGRRNAERLTLASPPAVTITRQG